jgi:hypothetical protein
MYEEFAAVTSGREVEGEFSGGVFKLRRGLRRLVRLFVNTEVAIMRSLQFNSHPWSPFLHMPRCTSFTSAERSLDPQILTSLLFPPYIFASSHLPSPSTPISAILLLFKGLPFMAGHCWK